MRCEGQEGQTNGAAQHTMHVGTPANDGYSTARDIESNGVDSSHSSTGSELSEVPTNRQDAERSAQNWLRYAVNSQNQEMSFGLQNAEF